MNVPDRNPEAEKLQQSVSFQQVLPFFSTYIGAVPSFQRLSDLVLGDLLCQEVWRRAWNERAGVNISFIRAVPYDRRILDEICRGDDVSSVATWLGVAQNALRSLQVPCTTVDHAFLSALGSSRDMNDVGAFVDYFCRYVFLVQAVELLQFISRERERELVRRLRVLPGALTSFHRQQYPNYSRITREQLIDCIADLWASPFLREIGVRVSG